MLLSEDDLSSNGGAELVAQPVAKRQKTEELVEKLTEDNKTVANRMVNLQQTPYYLAACVSALLAVYFSVVVMTGR